jgi:hypothetical protein
MRPKTAMANLGAANMRSPFSMTLQILPLLQTIALIRVLACGAAISKSSIRFCAEEFFNKPDETAGAEFASSSSSSSIPCLSSY